MATRTTVSLACTLGLAALLAGCHTPGGAGYTGASQTYVSSVWSPKTVTVIDTRTNEPVFQMEVPVGQQLSIQFVEKDGDDPVYSPARMRYQLWEAGKSYGSLQNSMTVPSAGSRKVIVDVREGPEYPPADGTTLGRVDRPEDRPGWWSPDGGTAPAEGVSQGNYEG